jgi:hypothetical protein
LLDDGADAGVRGPRGFTPLDAAAHFSKAENLETLEKIASLLRRRRAELTARAAVALGNAEWLRQRHEKGALTNPIEDMGGGLLRIISRNTE